MTEAYVEFMCKIASNINQSKNPAYNLLQSNYLMKCKAITGGHGLPAKKFSSIARCPKCCLEWTKDSEVTLKPNRLSKRQLKRLKSRRSKMSQRKLQYTNKILNGNLLEQTCTFCHHTTVTPLEKPKIDPVIINDASTGHNTSEIKKEINSNHGVKDKVKDNKISKATARLNNKTNLYTNAFDIFSLNNEKNTLKSAIKEPPKVIKNNKRKKDKFAGLCQKAVLASVQLKKEKVKQNKLDLFLKPSTNS